MRSGMPDSVRRYPLRCRLVEKRRVDWRNEPDIDLTMNTRRRWTQRLGMLLGLVGLNCGGSVRSERVLAWVRGQNLPPGTTRVLAIPDELAKASADAQVHVARLADGRTCILLKKSIGWKDNFEGVLACDAPLLATETVVAPPAPRSYVTLSGHAIFEELYVRARHDDRTFDVYFDLN